MNRYKARRLLMLFTFVFVGAGAFGYIRKQLAHTPGHRDDTKAAFASVESALGVHRARSGRLPAALDELVAAGELASVPPDGWDRPLHYEVDPGGRRYRLRSRGADDRLGTADDLEVRGP